MKKVWKKRRTLEGVDTAIGYRHSLNKVFCASMKKPKSISSIVGKVKQTSISSFLCRFIFSVGNVGQALAAMLHELKRCYFEDIHIYRGVRKVSVHSFFVLKCKWNRWNIIIFIQNTLNFILIKFLCHLNCILTFQMPCRLSSFLF